jgi:hypothetical protein
MNHIQFEKKLMEMILAGNHPILEELRNQYLTSTIESRKFTGGGFYTHFRIKNGTKPLVGEKTFQIGDVDASLGDIKEAMGFVLFIKNGYLSFLEGYTLTIDTWPNDYSNVSLIYDGPEGTRDLKKLETKWS